MSTLYCRGPSEPGADDDIIAEVVDGKIRRSIEISNGVTCRCGNVMIANNVTRLGRQVYRCQQASRGDRPGPHAQQGAANVDAYVEAVIVERLSRPDIADLVTPKRPTRRTARSERACVRDLADLLGAWLHLADYSVAGDLIAVRHRVARTP